MLTIIVVVAMIVALFWVMTECALAALHGVTEFKPRAIVGYGLAALIAFGILAEIVGAMIQ